MSSSACSCSGRPFLLQRFGVLLCGVWVDLGGGVLVICDCGLLLVGGVVLCGFGVGSVGGLGALLLSGESVSVGVSQFSSKSGWWERRGRGGGRGIAAFIMDSPRVAVGVW